MTRLRALRQRIRDAFAEVPAPSDDAYARRLFEGRRWKELRGARVDAAYDELPQLGPDAFRYYLPAYLLRALDALDGPSAARGRAAEVLEFTLYALMDTTNEMLLAGTFANTRVFSDDEKAAIREFLETIGRQWDRAEHDHARHIASALRRFG